LLALLWLLLWLLLGLLLLLELSCAKHRAVQLVQQPQQTLRRGVAGRVVDAWLCNRMQLLKQLHLCIHLTLDKEAAHAGVPSRNLTRDFKHSVCSATPHTCSSASASAAPGALLARLRAAVAEGRERWMSGRSMVCSADSWECAVWSWAYSWVADSLWLDTSPSNSCSRPWAENSWAEASETCRPPQESCESQSVCVTWLICEDWSPAVSTCVHMSGMQHSKVLPAGIVTCICFMCPTQAVAVLSTPTCL
jgi:hypothetical protein